MTNRVIEVNTSDVTLEVNIGSTILCLIALGPGNTGAVVVLNLMSRIGPTLPQRPSDTPGGSDDRSRDLF